MNKDINIDVHARYAGQAKKDLDGIAGSAKNVGDTTERAGEKGAAGTTKATQKLSTMGRVMASIKGQLLGLAGAWGVFAIAAKVISAVNAKLERAAQLLTSIHEKSLSLLEVGQSLEMQTGTSGEQRQWTKKAIEMQQAGGLKDVSTAAQMMVSGDIAFADSGGIKNPEVMNLLKELAPMIGAGGLGGEEAGQFFGFAGTAGIEATPEAYKEYFAKLLAGWTSSKSTDFGAFMTGLQTSGTSFLTMGGTLDEAISMYVSALAVSSNESEAATLLNQALRVSSGGNEKLRGAIESSSGVNWNELSMDQRLQSVLKYTASLPESQRSQLLNEQGVEGNIAIQVSKLVSPEALASADAARRSVGSASSADADVKINSYMNSTLADSRSRQAERESKKFEVSKQLADWQERIKDARAEFEVLLAEGKDKFLIKDSIEPHVIAFKKLQDELSSIPEEGLSPDLLYKRNWLLSDIESSIGSMTETPWGLVYPEGRADKRGQEYSNRVNELQGELQAGPTVVNHYHYENITNSFPMVGGDKSGPRFTQD